VSGPGPKLPESDPRLAALHLLRPPAFLLLALGIVSVGFSVAAALVVLLGHGRTFSLQGTELVIPVLDLRMVLAIGVWAMCGSLAIWGGLNAMRLRRYGWAVVGAGAALAPVFPLCIPGTLVGIWMLVALRRPGVKNAFEA
jgi:hypothetical protein